MAKRGTTEVHADTLTAHYRPSKGTGARGRGKGTGQGDRGRGTGGETEIYRLDADGHVTIKGERQTVVGDQAVYDVDQQIGIVTGKALKMTTATDVVTARDSLEWYDQKQIAVARGDAVAVREMKVIRADVLTAHMTKDKSPPAAGKPDEQCRRRRRQSRGTGDAARAADESSRISRVDAQGNVLVSTQTDIGRGDYGVYNADSGIATLLGNVTVTRGANTIRGEYAVMDLNNNISRMMAAPATPGDAATRVEGLFVRQDQAAAPAGTPRRSTPRQRAKTVNRSGERYRPRAEQDSRRFRALGAGRGWSPTTAASSVRDWAKASSGGRSCATSTSPCSAAKSSVCSGRTARERRHAFTSSPV